MINVLCLGNEKSIFFSSLLNEVLIEYNLVYKHENDFNNLEELEKFYIRNHIDFILLPNPYGNEKRLKLYNEFRKSTFIKYRASDRGALPNSWFFDPNGFNADSSSYDSVHWDKPLAHDREKRVIEYIENEIRNDVALEAQGKRQGGEGLRKKLNIDTYKKVLFVPLQRPSDTVIKYFSGNVENMEHFLQQVVKIQEALNDEWVILVKKHPLEVERLHSNVLRYVDHDTHFKDLIELSDAVLLINSGVGVISMMYQKPVFHFGKAFYSHHSLNKEVKNAQEVVNHLKDGVFKVDFEKVKRFISYLIEDFYSFGNFITEERIERDGSKRTITKKIDFYKINGLPRKSKSTTLLVTDIEFWKADIGNRQRILRFIQYLVKKIALRILFLKNITEEDKIELEKLNIIHIIDSINEIDLSKDEF